MALWALFQGAFVFDIVRNRKELEPLLKQQAWRYGETDRAIKNMSGWPAEVSKELQFAGHEFRSKVCYIRVYDVADAIFAYT